MAERRVPDDISKGRRAQVGAWLILLQILIIALAALYLRHA